MTRKRGSSRPGAKPRPMPGARDEALEARLGHVFNDRALLSRALTHSSSVRRGQGSYQRLEFLGDRVLGLAVADALFADYPRAQEGELAKRHTMMVRAEACAEVARALDLAPHVRVAASERRGGREIAEAILADVAEALLGAVFVEAGYEAARAIVMRLWSTGMTDDIRLTDAKSALQEWALGQGLAIPVYRLAERTGPDHAPRFVIEAHVDGRETGRAEGASKREAEQAAARDLLTRAGVWTLKDET